MRPTLFLISIFAMVAVCSSAQTAISPSAERNAILYNMEEEKMARDLFTAFENKWNSQVFSNIARTEQDHFDYLLKMAQEMNMEIPEAILSNGEGVYTNETLQKEYNSMLASGSKSLIDALTVGARMEEMEIVDLHKVMDVTDHTKVFLTYDRLFSAARNHLRAFVRNLKAQGIEYTPMMLSREEYDKIVGETIKFKVNPVNDL